MADQGRLNAFTPTHSPTDRSHWLTKVDLHDTEGLADKMQMETFLLPGAPSTSRIIEVVLEEDDALDELELDPALNVLFGDDEEVQGSYAEDEDATEEESTSLGASSTQSTSSSRGWGLNNGRYNVTMDRDSLPLGDLRVQAVRLWPSELAEGLWPEDFSLSDHGLVECVFLLDSDD